MIWIIPATGPRGSLMSMTNLFSHLLDRLDDNGVDAVFGLPGDFALGMFREMERTGIRVVVCAHEPAVGYAADGYARMRGFSATVVTYGAGALNMVNAVAQAYAERVPVLVISAAPPAFARERDLLLHHRVKDFDSQLRVFEQVTCASARLDATAKAADEIERVLARMLEEKRPGYLEIPADMVCAELTTSARPDRASIPARERPEATDDALAEITSALRNAEAPVLLAGVEIVRYGLRDSLREFAERWTLPTLNTMLGKTALSERHPLSSGTFMGVAGAPTTVDAIRGSDFVLALGMAETDVNLGLYTLSPEGGGRRVIRLDADGSPRDLRRVLPALARHARPRRRRRRSAIEHNPPGRMFDTPAVIHAVNSALEHHDLIVTVDVGDVLFSGCALRARDVLAPAYYASMGFAVPAALGAMVACPDRRAIALVGDGAFQMTGTELGTIVRYGLDPIIVVLDNRGYETLRCLDEPRPCYDTARWDYAMFARAAGVDAVRVSTLASFEEALDAAIDASAPVLIEASIARTASETLETLARSARTMSTRIAAMGRTT